MLCLLLAANNAGGTSACLVQKDGKFFQDRAGSRSGLNSNAVIRPRPRCAVTISGVSPALTTASPSRTEPTATCNVAISNAESSVTPVGVVVVDASTSAGVRSEERRVGKGGRWRLG